MGWYTSCVVHKHLLLKKYWANLYQIWNVAYKFNDLPSQGEVILGTKSVKEVYSFKILCNNDQRSICHNCKIHEYLDGNSYAKVWPCKSYSENALLILKASLFQGINQTNWGYSNDDQGKVYQNFKLHYSQDRDSCAKVWPC